MISSVVARLQPNSTLKEKVLEQLSRNSNIEIGPIEQDWRVPLVICSNNPTDMENNHRWVESLDGVEFLDVVFVHFEELEQIH